MQYHPYIFYFFHQPRQITFNKLYPVLKLAGFSESDIVYGEISRRDQQPGKVY